MRVEVSTETLRQRRGSHRGFVRNSMIDVEVAGKMREYPGGLETNERFLDRLHQFEVRDRVEPDVGERVGYRFADTDHPGGFGGNFLQPRELGTFMTRFGIRTQHTRVDSVPLVGQAAKCRTTTEQFVI